MSAALRLYLDHVLIGVRDLESSACAFEGRLGFTLTPEGVHPGRGTHNRLAVFVTEYLELIAVRDPAECVFRPSLNAFLESREGLYMFAVGTDDLDGTVSELRRRGVDVSDPTPGARSAGDGVPGYTWRAAPVPTDATPGSETFLLQHDVAIGDRYTVPADPTRHANEAMRVHRLVLAVHDADSAGAAWARLGLEIVARQPGGGVRMALPNSYLDLVAPTGPGALADFLREHGGSAVRARPGGGGRGGDPGAAEDFRGVGYRVDERGRDGRAQAGPGAGVRSKAGVPAADGRGIDRGQRRMILPPSRFQRALRNSLARSRRSRVL